MLNIRKYGLQHCDLSTSIKNVAFLLKILTLKIDDRDKKRVPIIFYIIMFVAIICYFYVHLVSMIWFVFCRCPETGDLLSALIVFSLGIASEISAVKFINMIIYIKDIRRLVADCLSYDSEVIPGSRFSNNLLRTLRDVKKRAMLYWVVIIGNGLIYASKPILLPGRHFMEDFNVLYGLEPMFETPNYQIAFCMLSISVSFICYLSANVSAFLIIMVGYVEAQMLALSEELTHVWDDAEEKYQQNKMELLDIGTAETNDDDKDSILNVYVKENSKKIAHSHAVNIDLLGQLEGIFKGGIAIEFCLLITALIAELLGGLENTYMAVPFALMQVGMDCLVGQRVIDASVVFKRAVYDSKWERFDKNNMKSIYIMLLNSQRSRTLSAGGVTKLNYVSFMSIMKSIYSTYTTLRSTMD